MPSPDKKNRKETSGVEIGEMTGRKSLEHTEPFSKSKYGFLFQGMGADFRTLVHRYNDVQKEILHDYCGRVQKAIALNLWSYLFHPSEVRDDRPYYNWVAIYTMDYLLYGELLKLGIEPGLLIGYSMGLITVLACGGAITFETGLDLLRSTGEYLQHPREHEEGMAVIIGLTVGDIAGLIRQQRLGNTVGIASENNEHCIVISGRHDHVEQLMAIAQTEGALKVKDLNAPYAIHSKYAVWNIEAFIKDVAKAKVKESTVPVMSTLNQEILQNSFDYKVELVQNMTMPMNWKAALMMAEKLGIGDFVEVSFDNSLTKVSKLVNRNYRFFNYDKVPPQYRSSSI